MTHDQRPQFIANQLAELQKLHAKFIDAISAMPNKEVAGGTLIARPGEIAAVVLGIPLRVSQRAISDGNEITALEYSFVAAQDGHDITIWQLYLDHHGNLYKGVDLKERLCDFNNPYLPKTVVSSLVEKLLKSVIFAPSA